MADYPVTPHTPALSEQEIIRRQKLQSLIDAGQNPYAVTHFDVTHHSKEITDNFESIRALGFLFFSVRSFKLLTC